MITTSIQDNITMARSLMSIKQSFDYIERELFFGKTKVYMLAINGFTQTEVLQHIVADVQSLSDGEGKIQNLDNFIDCKLGFAQVSYVDDWEPLIKNLLSGQTILIVDGFAKAVSIDTRTYPLRSITEPDTEKVTRGAKDGFVENIIMNTALMRRRIRDPKLTFELHQVGEDSKTDVAIAYIKGKAEEKLIEEIRTKLDSIKVTSLTMGMQSLKELLIPRSYFHPLPSVLTTERPDVASSYLEEGYVLLVPDASPMVMVLPCSIFQFTQSPEDYYKSPVVGNYIRAMRLFSLLASLLLLPLFLLFGAYIPLPEQFSLVSTDGMTPIKLFVLVLIIEVTLDLFRYSTSHTSERFAGALSIVGGLIIGDVAVKLEWASPEVLFYGAATMLATLSIASLDMAEGLRIYRIFLVLCTGFFGLWGFAVGLAVILISVITTPTFGKTSYFWPLVPFQWKALKTLLFRYPTVKAQPSSLLKEQKSKKNE
ncbi:MAG: spore germination protein [Lachnospiraceae bacterium]|nr:spore germination protein [Lachnospiraceae bacterium]